MQSGQNGQVAAAAAARWSPKVESRRRLRSGISYSFGPEISELRTAIRQSKNDGIV